MRLRRRLMTACVTIAAAGLALNAALPPDHPPRYEVVIFVVDSIGVAAGLLWLRSTRGRE